MKAAIASIDQYIDLTSCVTLDFEQVLCFLSHFGTTLVSLCNKKKKNCHNL